MTNDSDRPDEPLAAHAVRPPTAGNGTKALIGLLLAGMAGMMIFLFVNISKDGKIRPGPMRAHAGCVQGHEDCLPDVSYTDTAGVSYSHESLAGKVVLVNFWATWCNPCKAEIPALSKIYDKYKAKGVVFLGVMADNPSPDSQALLNFQSDHEMTYPVVRVNSDLMLSYHYPESLPTTFVYDRHGKQVLNRVGVLRETEIDSLLGQLVAQN